MSTKLQRFLDVLLMLVIMLPSLVGAMWLFKILQLAHCPPSTFLAGSVRPELQLYGLIGAMLALTLFVRHWLLHFFPGLNKFIGLRGTNEYKSSRHASWVWAAISFASFVVLFAASLTGVLSSYCLSNQSISVRAWPWSVVRQHEWQDVVAVVTSCSRGARGRWNTPYILIMDDHDSLNIGDSPRNLEDAYPRLTAALESANYVFDSSRVGRDCDAPDLALLRKHP